MATAAGTPVPEDPPAVGITAQLPWSQIPKFVPGTTNVQEDAQKLKFLAALWPADQLELLAPRAALMVEGSAFKLVAKINPTKLKTNSLAGVQALVEAIGGSWGSTELEERYEYFEKALYGTIQKGDETNDSYLARMDSNFTELISRGTTLEEVRAYILLRQSTLSGEDKKRILLEHGGDLKYPPVTKSFRLLGSRFFNEFQANRAGAKTKVYDVNVTEDYDGSHHDDQQPSGSSERVFHTQVIDETDPDHLDTEYVDALAAQHDEDALVVNGFEAELEEFLQETPQMFEAFTTYMEARAKLVEKRKARGFWPLKGKSRYGKGKGKGKRPRDRDQLLAKIARSHCRRCGAQGHWKAEYPNPPSSEKGQTAIPASANVVVVDRPQEVHQAEAKVEEVFSEDESDQPSQSAACLQNLDQHFADCFVIFDCEDRCNQQSRLSNRMQRLLNKTSHRGKHARYDYMSPGYASGVSRVQPRKWPRADGASVRGHDKVHEISYEPNLLDEAYVTHESCRTHAILDTGASRCIIGKKTLDRLQSALPNELVQQFAKQPSSVTFRFGNNQSLTSVFSVRIPLKHINQKKLWLSIEVVPGNTPFLFSKRAFKLLHGSLDTVTDTCLLKKVSSNPIELATSPTGLYLLNLMDICTHDSFAYHVHQTEQPKPFNSVKGVSLAHQDGVRSLDVVGVQSTSIQLPASCRTRVNQLKPPRAFRAKSAEPENDTFPSVASNASHGVDVEDHRRVRDPVAGSTSASLCAADGTPGSDHRDQLRGQSRGDSTTECHELQTQRKMLEALMKRSNPPTTGSPKPNALEMKPSVLPVTSAPKAVETIPRVRQSGLTRNPNAAKTQNRTASGPEVETWSIHTEDSFEELIMEEEVQGVLRAHMNSGSSAASAVVGQALPGNLSLEEWGTHLITWGRKHRGKTFMQTMIQDPQYLSWSQARYNSLPPEQQDFVRFGQLWMRHSMNEL